VYLCILKNDLMIFNDTMASGRKLVSPQKESHGCQPVNDVVCEWKSDTVADYLVDLNTSADPYEVWA
jgi:hypothetical protein